MSSEKDKDPKEQDLQQLKVENEKLKAQLAAYEQSKEQAGLLRFFVAKKAGGFFLLGPRLKESLTKMLEGDLSKDNVAEVLIATLYRFTRIGLFAFLVALLPIGILTVQTVLLSRQNELFQLQNNKIDKQNVRLDQQTNLLEADRRSALVLESGNVMGLIGQELNDKENTEDSLSQALIARIIALSQTLKPYKYLNTDSTLTERKVSPERGYLLIGLVESKVALSSYNKISERANFEEADLRNAVLKGKFLSGINLKGADLAGADLWHTSLGGANLEGARLFEADLVNANLEGANLERANLVESNLVFTQLPRANLQNAVLQKAELKKTNLEGANLQGADLRGAELLQVNLRGTNLQGAHLQGAALYFVVLRGADLTGGRAFKSQISSFLESGADTTGMIWLDNPKP